MQRNLEKARSHYRFMTDSQLLIFAEKNYKTLRSEILPELINELKERDIGNEIIQEVLKNSNIILLDDAEIKKIADTIKNLNCPECGLSGTEIYCFNIRAVTSYIVRSILSTKSVISCQDCYRSNFWAINFGTLAIGWLSLSGIILTPYALYKNFLNYNCHAKTLESNLILFIYKNHQEIIDKTEPMMDFIKNKNANIDRTSHFLN